MQILMYLVCSNDISSQVFSIVVVSLFRWYNYVKRSECLKCPNYFSAVYFSGEITTKPPSLDVAYFNPTDKVVQTHHFRTLRYCFKIDLSTTILKTKLSCSL